MGSWRVLAYLLLPAWAGMRPGVLGKGAPERPQHRLQHGSCTYTFLLPELGGCEPAAAPAAAARFQVSNSLQRDAPSLAEAQWPVQRLQQLETVMENNTQWLQKSDGFNFDQFGLNNP
ncbi:hypothetical protein Chor_001708 [Crotalus horridus]